MSLEHSVLTIGDLKAIEQRLFQKSPTDNFAIYLVQFRYPRSKKARIRKKWAKDFRNFRSVFPFGKFSSHD
jgi:hypothetical protein